METMGRAAPVAVLEVMGRDTGWLAAASVLGKREERDAPHVVVVPEEPVVEDRFLGLVEDAYARARYGGDHRRRERAGRARGPGV